MSQPTEAINVPDTTTTAVDGTALPDLAYVGRLLATLDAQSSSNQVSAANEVHQAAGFDADATDVAIQYEERDAMTIESEQVPLALPAQCLLRDAVEIKATLIGCAERSELQMDVGAVERVDAAFIQVLLALAKQRKDSGKSALRFIGASAALGEAVKVLGLAEHLAVPEVAA